VSPREVTLQFEVPEVYRLHLRTGMDGTIREARVEGELASREVGRLVASRYRDPHKALYVVERVCGACSQAHTLAFSCAVERVLGVSVPMRAQAIRTVTAELERIQSHLLTLSETAALAGARGLEQELWRTWQKVTAVLAAVTGSRVHYGINCIGGVVHDLPPEALRAASGALADLGRSLGDLDGVFEREAGSRLRGLGVWKAAGRDLPGTGPNQRASGSPRDVRAERPYLLYADLPLMIPIRTEGDVLARTSVRLEELHISHRMVKDLLSALPEGEVRIADLGGPRPGSASMSVEAPRGEDRHDVVLSADGEVDALAIRVPTEDSLLGVSEALIGVHEEDARLVVASFDLCLSCFGGT